MCMLLSNRQDPCGKPKEEKNRLTINLHIIMATSTQNFIDRILPWLLGPGLRIFVILAVAYVISKFIKNFIEKFVRRAVVSDHFSSKEAEKKREDTISRIFNGAVNVLIYVTVLLMILSELGMEIGPLLATAGVAGLAVGFGGQYLIRDLISGFFIILENQYRIGDVVCFGDICGLVEDISLRMTTLRDLDGTVHCVPHGEIKTVSNLSKDFSRVNLNIGVAYSSDLEKVIQVINAVGNELAQEYEWKNKIIKPPQFVRVNDFGDSAVIVKIIGETKPLEQWSVSGEFRKRIKIAFDREGIEIPFPQRVIHKPQA